MKITSFVNTKRKIFNLNEMRHLAVNYAITCSKGYVGSFDDWYKLISPNWRKIANRKYDNT